MALSPTQHKLLLYGVPAVAALALFAYLSSRSSSSSAGSTASGTTTAATTSAADTPIGLSTLADFENAITTELAGVGQTISSLQGQVNGLAAAPASGTTTASPAPNPLPATTSPAPVSTASSWGLIPNPTAGSELAGAGVAYETVGAHQYYDTAQVQHVATAAQGAQLSKQGFYLIALQGGEYFNPNQTTAGRAGK